MRYFVTLVFWGGATLALAYVAVGFFKGAIANRRAGRNTQALQCQNRVILALLGMAWTIGQILKILGG